MSRPSFKLSKADGRWWAAGEYDSGRRFRMDVGPSTMDKAKAEVLAEVRVDKGVQMGKLAIKRHQVGKTRAPFTKAGATVPAALPAQVPLPAVDEPTPVNRPAPPPPPPPDPPSEEPEPAPAPERTEEIAAKLRALGDGRPIEPDDVHEPGDDPRADDQPDADPIDEEAGELIAEIAAAAIVSKNVSVVSNILRSRKPPRRPGDGPEKMREWYHAGMVFNMKKLFGRATSMGPTGKMFVGALLFNVAMFWNSEEVSSGGASEAAPRSPVADADKAPPPDANNSSPWSSAPKPEAAPPAPSPLQLVRQTATRPDEALGKFK